MTFSSSRNFHKRIATERRKDKLLNNKIEKIKKRIFNMQGVPPLFSLSR